METGRVKMVNSMYSDSDSDNDNGTTNIKTNTDTKNNNIITTNTNTNTDINNRAATTYPPIPSAVAGLIW